jgi:hypothetical protein
MRYRPSQQTLRTTATPDEERARVYSAAPKPPVRLKALEGENAGDEPRVTERSKNPKGSAAIRGKPILPLRKTLECRTARAAARAVESTREDGPGRKP